MVENKQRAKSNFKTASSDVSSISPRALEPDLLFEQGFSCPFYKTKVLEALFPWRKKKKNLSLYSLRIINAEYVGMNTCEKQYLHAFSRSHLDLSTLHKYLSALNDSIF